MLCGWIVLGTRRKGGVAVRRLVCWWKGGGNQGPDAGQDPTIVAVYRQFFSGAE